MQDSQPRFLPLAAKTVICHTVTYFVMGALAYNLLHYADLFATDHLSIDDAVYDDLRLHFTEEELVELGVHCAYAVGMGRLAASWSVTDDLPDAFRSAPDSPLAPWHSAGVVASG